MKSLIRITILSLLLTGTAALAQTVQLVITVAGAAATETTGTNSAGATIETAGPVALTLEKCVGTAAVCGTSPKTAPVTGSASPWQPVGTNPISMTSGSITVTDPEAAGAVVYYAAQAEYTDTTLGGVESPWFPFSITVSSPTAPTAPGTPGITGTIITTVTTTTTTVVPVQ